MNSMVDKITDYFESTGEDKIRLIDMWNEFSAELADIGEFTSALHDPKFKRTIGLISPTRAMTLATYESLGDVPMMWDDEHETFNVTTEDIDIWYELND